MLRKLLSALSTIVDKATLVLAGLAGLSLMAMVGVIAYGIILRYVFATPVLGTNEIVQTISVAVVMLGLPFCTAQEGHVRVDVLDNAIGRAGRLAGDILSRTLAIAVLSVLVMRTYAKSLDALEFGDATNMLGLPIWPFYAMIAVGMACCVVILTLQLALVFAGWRDAK